MLASAVALAGCEPEDFLTWATVLEVDEVVPTDVQDPEHAEEDDLREPEAGWRVQLLLEDGSAISLTYSGERRYEPGERVRVLRTPDGKLLL